MRNCIPSLLCLGLLAVAPAAAQELPGDPYVGERIARQECARCHAVERGEYQLLLLAPPSFQALANNPEHTVAVFRILLTTPHQDMPDLILDPAEIDDVVSYVMSLR